MTRESLGALAETAPLIYDWISRDENRTLLAESMRAGISKYRQLRRERVNYNETSEGTAVNAPKQQSAVAVDLPTTAYHLLTNACSFFQTTVRSTVTAAMDAVTTDSSAQFTAALSEITSTSAMYHFVQLSVIDGGWQVETIACRASMKTQIVTQIVDHFLLANPAARSLFKNIKPLENEDQARLIYSNMLACHYKKYPKLEPNKAI